MLECHWRYCATGERIPIHAETLVCRLTSIASCHPTHHLKMLSRSSTKRRPIMRFMSHFLSSFTKLV